MRNRPTGWLCVCLLSLCACLTAQPKPIGPQAPAPPQPAKSGLAGEKPAQEPFDLTEIEKLLRADLSPKRIIGLVGQYGVSFALTDNAEQELRKLGAGDQVLLAIARNRVYPGAGLTTPASSSQPALPASQFALTWTDPATGLMWAKESNTSNVTWNQAKDYCANSRLGGYPNWRLATIEELEGLYDPAQDVDRCHVKGGIKFHDVCWSWSGSPGIESKEAWGFGFLSGEQSSIPFEESRYNTRVLCVRRAGR